MMLCEEGWGQRLGPWPCPGHWRRGHHREGRSWLPRTPIPSPSSAPWPRGRVCSASLHQGGGKKRTGSTPPHGGSPGGAALWQVLACGPLLTCPVCKGNWGSDRTDLLEVTQWSSQQGVEPQGPQHLNAVGSKPQALGQAKAAGGLQASGA